MLFAVMTKIGFYALLRSSSVVLEAPSLAGAASPWLHGLALLTIGFGALGVLAARRLSVLTAYLVVISTGTLIYAVATGGPAVIAAALYYLPHTTFATAGLFFVAGTIAARRGQLGDTLVCGELADMRLVGVLFAILAIAVSGLPPLSGFLGKVMLMRANPPGPDPAFWSALLISGFVMTVALARAASTLFWERREPADPTLAARPADPRFLLVAATLLLIPIALTVFARPIAEHMRATAQDLARPAAYVDAVMGGSPVARETRR
jgi:multicomponent K+:H+ antiporter subunit D